MLDECRITRREARSLGAAAQHGHDQRPGIVVDAITMIPVRHGIDGVLEHSDRVAHPVDGIERKRGCAMHDAR